MIKIEFGGRNKSSTVIYTEVTVIEPCKQSQYCTAHAYVVLCMHRLVQYIHDVCMMHIRRNCVHGLPKLLVV